MVVEAEQQFDKLTRAHHLSNQVQRDYHQRAAGGEHADWPLLQSVGGHIGKGIAAEVTQAFGNQEQDDRPADEEAERVDQPVVAGGVDQRGDAEERRRRHKVTGNRQPVLEAGNVAAGGVVIVTRTYALRRPPGDIQRQDDENQEHDNRLPVGRLAFDRAAQGIRRAGRKRKCGG